MVVVQKKGLQVDLVWCDSLQRDGRQPLNTYAQYYHFLDAETNRSQAFQPTQHYTSALRMRTHTPVLRRQFNGTDCGIITLLYQQAVSSWYGTAAGQTFTDAHIQDLINSLRAINQDNAGRHREWVRIHMHTWWRGNWEGGDPVTPPGMHQQRQVQRRRHRRRVQETYMLECQSTDHSTTQAADTDTTRLEQESCTVIAAKESIRRKRNLQRIDAEEQADRAATEIVVLVEQDAQHSARSLTGSSTPLNMHTYLPQWLRVQC